MFKSLIIAATVASTLAASTAQADHRGRGGGRSNFGIGIGGGGVGVYYGRGGGWGGGWGGYGGGWNRGWGGYGRGYGWNGYGGWGGYYPYSSGYYYPSYSSGYYYSTPSYSTTVVQPASPAAPAPNFDGGAIVLTNPATNTETVEYALNGQIFSMKPGQSQRFTHDRDWVIEFNKGIGMGRYGLKSSTYKFKRTANGWELFEQAASHPTEAVAPPPPTNDPVRSAERLEPTGVRRNERDDSVPPPVPDEDQPRERRLTNPPDEETTTPSQVPQP